MTALNTSKPALILGNGPSLDKIDASVFDSFYTIGTNNVWAKFPVWGRNTDAVIIVDDKRLREIGSRYSRYAGELYIGHLGYFRPPLKLIRDTVGRDAIPIGQLMVPGWQKWEWLLRTMAYRIKTTINGFLLNKHEMSFQLNEGFLFGASVVVPAVQLAASLGFKKILLHGVDASYSPGKKHFAGINAQQHLPPRRFDYNFRADFEPLLVKAQVYFETMGIELIDCTPGGKLRFIPKGSLNDFVR